MSNTTDKLTLSDLVKDPKKYGLPTFQEFKKNPEKWRKNPDDLLAVADRGSQVLNRLVKRHRYFICGHEAATLEEVEKIAKNEGIDLKKMKMMPELEKVNAGKLEVHVHFASNDLVTPAGGAAILG